MVDHYYKNCQNPLIGSWEEFVVFLDGGYLGRRFERSAAILDDVTIRFRQKINQSYRLVDTFDLIYDMTIFDPEAHFFYQI